MQIQLTAIKHISAVCTSQAPRWDQYFIIISKVKHLQDFIFSIRTLQVWCESTQLVYMETLHLIQYFPCLLFPADVSSFLSQLELLFLSIQPSLYICHHGYHTRTSFHNTLFHSLLVVSLRETAFISPITAWTPFAVSAWLRKGSPKTLNHFVRLNH